MDRKSRFLLMLMFCVLVAFVLVPLPAAALAPEPARIEPEITVLIMSSYHPASVRLFSETETGLTVQLGTGRMQAPACGVSLNGDYLGIRCAGTETEKYRALTVTDLSGPVGVEIPGKVTRRYHGKIIVEAGTAELRIVNQVRLEDYLAGVVGGELDSEEPAAMQAQAVLARTWVIKNRMKHGTADACDLTHCQVYHGIDGETKRASEAVRRTAGLVATYNGQLIEVYYHSTSGGRTTSPGMEWGGQTPPYLKGVDDPWSSISPHYQWDSSLTPAEIRKLGFEGFNGTILGIEVKERNADDRAASVTVRLSTGTKTLTGQEFHRIMGQTLGWNYLKSDWFTVDSKNGRILFFGHGLGHGVGLSQWGAIGMSRKGYSFKEIIQFYFPGVEVKPWDGLWPQLPHR